MSARLSTGLGLQLARTSRYVLKAPLDQSSKRTVIGTIGEVEHMATVEAENQAISRQMTRHWSAGDVYAPHDLSGAEGRKWRDKHTPTNDAFDTLSINPLTLYKNFAVMSEYMTEMGRIRHARSTGLRPVNQRKISKAIRRAIALGLMPSVHRHPEIVKRDMEEEMQRKGRVR